MQFFKIKSKRRRRAERLLREYASAKDPLVRRILASVMLIISIWLTFSISMLSVTAIGMLMMGGPTFVLDAWHGNQTQYDDRMFAFILFVGLPCGTVSAAIGAALCEKFIRKIGLVSSAWLQRYSI
jgi:hypothetical protein